MPKKPRIRSLSVLGWALWDPATGRFVTSIAAKHPRFYSQRLDALGSIYYSPRYKVVRVKQTTSPL